MMIKLFVIGIGIAITCYFIREYRKLKGIKDNAVFTEGRVTHYIKQMVEEDHDDDTGGNIIRHTDPEYIYIPVIEYDHGEGKRISFKAKKHHRKSKQQKMPTFRLAYNAKYPAQVCFASELAVIDYYLVGTVVGILVSMIGVLFLVF